MASVTRGISNHRAKRAAASARVLSATLGLLRAGERFTEIPVERILTEANVSRSTFYVHFADKSALLIAIAEQSVDEVTATAESWWQTNHSNAPDAAEKTVLDLIKVYRKHATVLRTLAEVGAYDDVIRGVWRSRRERYNHMAAERMRIEQEKGLVDADVDVELAAAAVGQLVDATILDHVSYGSARRDKQVARAIARIGWLAYYGHVPA